MYGGFYYVPRVVRASPLSNSRTFSSVLKTMLLSRPPPPPPPQPLVPVFPSAVWYVICSSYRRLLRLSFIIYTYFILYVQFICFPGHHLFFSRSVLWPSSYMKLIVKKKKKGKNIYIYTHIYIFLNLFQFFSYCLFLTFNHVSLTLCIS